MAAPLAPRGLNPSCSLTVLRSTELMATKVLRGDGAGVIVASEPKIKRWRWRIEPLEGLGDILRVLRGLAGDPHACVIGEGVPAGAGPVICRSKADTIARDRRWCAFDCDGWTPPGWPLARTPTNADIGAAMVALRNTLPGLAGAACVYRLSSTAGLVKRADGTRGPGWVDLRCHLWFWFDRAVSPKSVKAWLGEVDPPRVWLGEVKARGVWDAGMLDAVRVHYVADPVCEGVLDPAGGLTRLGVIAGREAIALDGWCTGVELEAREEGARVKARARLDLLSRDRLPRGAGDYDDMVRIIAARARDAASRATSGSSGKSSARKGSGVGAFLEARKALTSAKALEEIGERGAVEWVSGLLACEGVAARTITNALDAVQSGEILKTLEGARASIKPRDNERPRSSGERLRSAADYGSPSIAKLPAVLVRDGLDALKFSKLAAGLGFDVLALGDEWRPEWATVLEGRPAVIVAAPGPDWPVKVPAWAALASAKVPASLMMLDNVPGRKAAATWAELVTRDGLAAGDVVAMWRARLAKVAT